MTRSNLLHPIKYIINIEQLSDSRPPPDQRALGGCRLLGLKGGMGGGQVGFPKTCRPPYLPDDSGILGPPWLDSGLLGLPGLDMGRLLGASWAGL